MQDSNINVPRLEDLMKSISEAKASLKHYHDQRTEALIRLDAFTYDIQLLETEKKNSSDLVRELKNEIQAQAVTHQSHVGELADQMQVLKFENESIRNDLLEKSLKIESLEKEIEAQTEIKNEMVQAHLTKQSELRADLELRLKNQIWEYRVRNEDLATRMSDLAKQKIEVELRADRLEKEMAQMRSHMMGILNIQDQSSQDSKLAEAKFAEARVAEQQVMDNRLNQAKMIEARVAAAKLEEAKQSAPKRVASNMERSESAYANLSGEAVPRPVFRTEPNAKPIAAESADLSMQEIRKLRAVDLEPDSVEDYLKRLGY